MFGNRLVTKQTPPEGVLVNKIMVCESLNFNKEFYFAILMDRATNGPVLVASTQGGMDIEAVAHETPELIHTVPVDINVGVTPQQGKWIAEKLGFSNIPQAVEQIQRLYKLFISCDATQVEINPFVETSDKRVFAIDAKINFDDNAEFRQKEIFAMRDVAEEDPREVEASKFNLNYIGLDGNIGCMVNGAGLAMATMDIIKLYKGKPANFLDVGGGANTSQITEAFKIISSDPQVKAILVNIFGGIMKCDIIANGIVQALKQIQVKQPIVVRLAGTNVELGQKILRESGYKIQTASDLDDAAAKVVATLN
jgi:succinyl-CoA synthetase beta subunit